MSETAPQSQAIAPRPAGADVPIGEQGVQLRTLEDAVRFAKWAVASKLVPEGDTESAVFIKLQAGAELGFPPMRALAALCVVNGRLSLMGEALLAKIRQSKVAQVYVFNDGEGDARRGVFRFERLDTGEKGEVAFSVADAKKAGLWNKKTKTGGDTPWVTFPDDMLIWKAVARGARRYFSDITLGLGVAEDVRDLPAHTIEVLPQPEAPRLQAPPATPDPLLARVTGGLRYHTEAEAMAARAVEPEIVPSCDPGPPFASNAEADRALAAEDDNPRARKPTGRL